MKANEIRSQFLKFFEEKGHRIVPSAPVIPHGDPTLLFANAGMNQFKDVFLGIGTRDYTRSSDTQKCIRVSGKHNDLDEVGHDTYHHTFFEMLGNWSFGDYYKKEAIAFAWELLVERWKLPVERLHATVFRTDDEAYELWKQYLPEERIHRCDEKDNFWEMGETGPCGPCSEIHYDFTPDLSGGALVNADRPEVVEIWNLVFMQYNRTADGVLEPLAKKHVDTGMGFERICAVLQGKESNYDTDVFTPIIKVIESLSGRAYVRDLHHPDGVAMRVMADHIRTLAFAIADGAFPGNAGRGYVLRRVLRRASRYARNLGLTEPSLYKLVQVLTDEMGATFPEIVEQRDVIERVVRSEEESFLATLDRGLERLDEIAARLNKDNGVLTIPGADVFQLYDTFGFPLDLTQVIAAERNIAVDVDGFHEHMQRQKERSRQARKKQSLEAADEVLPYTTEFTGYETLSGESKILHIRGAEVVLEATPFYVESGGQVSDTGVLTIGGQQYRVVDMRKSGAAIIHICDSDVEPLVGAMALAEVDAERRSDILGNHSATHLLHEALRQTLGPHIQQAGSLVAPEYLRFDFPHFQKVGENELRSIEDMVNAKIREHIPVITKTLPIEAARELPNVRMFFGDKYGDVVRVVVMDESFSVEFCGGTHVANTSEIGLFKIVGESSVAAGTRRVEAVTGRGVEQYIDKLQSVISAERERGEELQGKIKQLEKELAEQRLESLSGGVQEFIGRAKEHNGMRVVAEQVEAQDMEQLKLLGDDLRNTLGANGIGLLATIIGDKAQLACVVTDDLKGAYPAGKLVGVVAKQLGGGGGGKPHMATAGAKDSAKLPQALENFIEVVKEFGA